MPKRPDRFLLGHRGKGQVVYDGKDDHPLRWVEPITLTDAKLSVEKTDGGVRRKMAIYELVEKK